MSEYTPTTDEVRSRYKSGAWLNAREDISPFDPKVYEPIYYAEFDRWLAEVEREAAARAWDEGHAAGGQNAGSGIAALLTGLDAPEPIRNPYRAAEIRGEHGIDKE